MSLHETNSISTLDTATCAQVAPDPLPADGWSTIADILCLIFGLIIGYLLHRKWPEIVNSVRETLDTTWTEKIQAQEQETRKRTIDNFELGISKLCNIINCHTVDVGIIIAAGKDLEIVSINNSMRRMLQWPVDFQLEPDGTKKISVNDLMPSNLQAKHQKIVAKAVEAGTLPGSLMHPLRNIEVMTYGRNESIRGSLSLGVLTNEIPLSSPDCLFYAVFVQLEESESVSGSHSSSGEELSDEDDGDKTSAPLQASNEQARELTANIQPQVSQRPAEGGLENLWDNVWECTVGDSSDSNTPGVAKPRVQSSGGPEHGSSTAPQAASTAPAARAVVSPHPRASRVSSGSPEMEAISELDMIDSLMLGDDNSDQVASANTASGVSSNTTSRAASPDIRGGVRPLSPESPNTVSRVPSPDHPDAPPTPTGEDARRRNRQRSPDGRPLRRGGARGADTNEEDCFRNVVQHIYGDNVARSISTGGLPAPEEYPEVTVLFLDVVDFAKSCMVKTSSEVATWMSRVHEVVEAMLSVYAMRKVEIRGDCYIVVSGTNSVQGDLSNTQVTRMAAFATDVGKKLASLQGTQIRVGIATGPTTIAYIGGQKFAPTLCAFGDTVNMAARMEQSGKPGMVHMTERSASLLCQERELEWGLRKPPLHMTEVKGKGLMSTAWFDWDKDDFAILPSFNGGTRGRSFVYAGTELLSAAIRSVSPTRLLAHMQAAARSVSPVRLIRNNNPQPPAAPAAPQDSGTVAPASSTTGASTESPASVKASSSGAAPTAHGPASQALGGRGTAPVPAASAGTQAARAPVQHSTVAAASQAPAGAVSGAAVGAQSPTPKLGPPPTARHSAVPPPLPTTRHTAVPSAVASPQLAAARTPQAAEAAAVAAAPAAPASSPPPPALRKAKEPSQPVVKNPPPNVRRDSNPSPSLNSATSAPVIPALGPPLPAMRPVPEPLSCEQSSCSATHTEPAHSSTAREMSGSGQGMSSGTAGHSEGSKAKTNESDSFDVTSESKSSKELCGQRSSDHADGTEAIISECNSSEISSISSAKEKVRGEYQV